MVKAPLALLSNRWPLIYSCSFILSKMFHFEEWVTWDDYQQPTLMWTSIKWWWLATLKENSQPNWRQFKAGSVQNKDVYHEHWNDRSSNVVRWFIIERQIGGVTRSSKCYLELAVFVVSEEMIEFLKFDIEVWQVHRNISTNHVCLFISSKVTFLL